METKEKGSTLGILALIFSVLGCTFMIGIILAIIDLCKKDGKKKTLSIIALIVCGLWIVGALMLGGSDDSEKTETSNTTEVVSTEKIKQTAEEDIAQTTTENDTTEVTKEESEKVTEEVTEDDTQDTKESMTMGQKNALSKAQDYLRFTAFSYSGLISQLEYEGFTKEEATYAVDNCGADWNEQAAKKAQDYIDITSYSRQGLIDQLKYEGFTSEQAEYGVTAVGY